MRVLVTGASGFVGRHLAPALADARNEVIAMTRRPDAYAGVGEPVEGDVLRPGTLPTRSPAATWPTTSSTRPDRHDFRRGGLGDPDDSLSDHVRSRQECEGLLGAAGVPVTTVRALIGSMRNEVVVRDDGIRTVVPFEPLDYDGAALGALQQRVRRLGNEAA